MGADAPFQACDAETACLPIDPEVPQVLACIDADGEGPGVAGECLEVSDGDCGASFEVFLVEVDGVTLTPVCKRAPEGVFHCDAAASGGCVGCTVDSDCVFGEQCDVANGVCAVCVDNEDCTAQQTFSVCFGIGAEAHCGCSQNVECANGEEGGPERVCNTDTGACDLVEASGCVGSGAGDLFVDGVCGCSDGADCNGDTRFDGTSYVCE